MKRFIYTWMLCLLLSACAVTTPTPQPPGSPSAPQPTTPNTPNQPTASVTIHFIDVGQGDAVLIQSGDKNVLYDGGRSSTDALAYLQALGIGSLELVIASHADADHIGGLAEVVKFYKPKFYMDNGLTATTQVYQKLLEAVQSAGSQLLEPTGQKLSLGDTTLQIIPPPGNTSLDSNNNSIGVVVDNGEFETALTGDAERPEFLWWQTNQTALLQDVEVYKSAHHGSKNGDWLDSVQTWQPETVVISVGANNSYGHPTAEALALYQGVGATVFRTDLVGDVVVTGKNDGTYTTTTARTAP
jgi:competence protein ComEC